MSEIVSSAYRPLTVETLPGRLGALPAIRERLSDDPSRWRVREVGDGNLNLVFIVESDRGGLVVKQALPYVRLVGESWPLPLKRTFFEYHALTRQEARDPGRTPQVYHFDAEQALIVMEYLTPHRILRRDLEAGVKHENLAEQLGGFLAHTLFRGSDLSMSTAQRKADVALFADNVALSDITETLVFTDPYFAAPLNRHTSPQLDGIVATLRADVDLKVAAQQLKLKFCNHAEALVHGDLHTGSIMAHDGDARVIDPEFAIYGPFGFDVGMLIANFLMAYFAQRGYEQRPGDRDAFRAWTLETAEGVWTNSAASSRCCGGPSAPASCSRARSTRTKATRWLRSRRCPRCCIRSGSTRWDLRGSKCTAAFWASPISLSSSISRIWTCAPPAKPAPCASAASWRSTGRLSEASLTCWTSRRGLSGKT